MNLQKREIIEQIVEQANDAYAELENTKKTAKDWKDFGLRMKGIYMSYYKADDLCSEAMRDILSGKRRNLNPEIIDGNFGFRTIALSGKDTQRTLQVAREISKKFGQEHAKRYVKGVPTCLAWACNELEERKKQVKKNFEDFTDIVVKQTGI